MIALVTYQRCRFRGHRWTQLVRRCDTRFAISRPSTEASTVLATTSKIQAGVVRWPRTPEFSSPNILMVRIFPTMWLSIEKEKKIEGLVYHISLYIVPILCDGKSREFRTIAIAATFELLRRPCLNRRFFDWLSRFRLLARHASFSLVFNIRTLLGLSNGRDIPEIDKRTVRDIFWLHHTVFRGLFVWNNNGTIICSLWSLGASFFSSHASVLIPLSSIYVIVSSRCRISRGRFFEKRSYFVSGMRRNGRRSKNTFHHVFQWYAMRSRFH